MLVRDYLLVFFIFLEIGDAQISDAGCEFALVLVAHIVAVKMFILHLHVLDKCKNLVALVLVQEV